MFSGSRYRENLTTEQNNQVHKGQRKVKCELNQGSVMITSV